MNPDHLESRKRTLGQLWRRQEESVMQGEGSELLREGEREEEKGRGTQNPQLLSPSERIELPQGTHRPLWGTIFYRAMKKLVLPSPPA